MPEMKRNFTKGKMNKDLDERLVPPGEYRDAMNIQVSTSEGSDVGAVQNVLGNTPGCEFNIAPPNSYTVGSVSDEKNDTLYWLVSGQETLESEMTDMILRRRPSNITETGSHTCEAVFVDKFAFTVPNPGVNTNVSSLTLYPTGLELLNQIYAGWTITGFDTANNSYSNTVTMNSVTVSDSFQFDWNFVPVSTPTYNSSLIGIPSQLAIYDNVWISMNYASSGPNAGLWIIPGLTSSIFIQNPDPLPNLANSFIDIDIYSNPQRFGVHGVNTYGYEILSNAPVTVINASSGNNASLEIVGLDIPLNLDPSMQGWGAATPAFTDTMGKGYIKANYSTLTTQGVNLAEIPDNGYIILPLSYDTTNYNIGDQITLNENTPWVFNGCVNAIDSGNNMIQVTDCNDPSIVATPPQLILNQYETNGSILINDSIDVEFGGVDLNLGGGSYDSLILQGPRTLNFNHNDLILGINIIDEFLFWTDNKTEPKKISIPRSVAGTDPLGTTHTDLILPDKSGNLGTFAGHPPGINKGPIREENITVIKKAPHRPPSLKIGTALREGPTGEGYSLEMITQANGDINYISNVGEPLYVKITDLGGNACDFEVGDIIGLADNTYSPPFLEGYQVRVKINEINTGPWTNPNGVYSVGNGETAYLIEVLSLSDTASIVQASWNVELVDNEKFLFERKLPRFAYRYKYVDNEYSTYGPFSDAAFYPGEFEYQPVKAYNQGMTNKIRTLTLLDFVTNDMPRDVVQIDILYKNENSSTVYLMDSIKENDAGGLGNNWNMPGSNNFLNSDKGSYDITTENIYSALPANQSIRTWDNVPITALAQDVSGNRVVYGNYTQGYNIEEVMNDTNGRLVPDINVALIPRSNLENEVTAQKSIKSLRDYDIGVVWGDKYGRETPVITPSSGSFIVPKTEADKFNYLQVYLDKSPHWADYYRFYIKETSNEYYNLAVDRVYDAEDGNIWVSFPSVDRNKIDEDTYIILKKGSDSDVLIEEKARYKVVAIENEAPEYIKTNYEQLARTNTDNTRFVNSCIMWGGKQDVAGGGNQGCPIYPIAQGPASPPVVGRKSFSIDKNGWNDPWSSVPPPLGPGFAMGLPDLKELFTDINADSTSDEFYVSFTKETVAIDGSLNVIAGSKYRVVEVVTWDDDGGDFNTVDINTDSVGTLEANLYEIKLSEPIKSTDEFVVGDYNKLGLFGLKTDNIHVIFWKKTISNKPEFDGRFFVKIYSDTSDRENLSKTPAVIKNWVTTASMPLYLIDDTANLNDPLNATTDDFDYAPLGSGGGLTYTENQWNNLLKFGGNNVSAGWFIDKASFASKQPLNNSNYGNTEVARVHPGGGTFDSSDVTSNQPFNAFCSGCLFGAGISVAGPTFFTQFGTFITFDEDVGDGKSLGNVGMKGAFQDSLGYKHIDISFSYLGPTRPGGKTVNFNLDWRVGDPANTEHSDELPIVQGLSLGKRFKFSGNGIIYKIIGVTKFRLHNYQGKTTADFASTQFIAGGGTYWHTEHLWQTTQMGKRTNRRHTYRIKYEIDFAASDLTLLSNYDADALTSTDTIDMNPDYTAISNVAAGGTVTNAEIFFLEEFNVDGENKISPNPAIFETEPKEDADLDLYYEASSSFSTFPITDSNIGTYLPIGTTISLPTSLSSVIVDGIFITGYQTVIPGSPTITVDISYPLDTIQFNELQAFGIIEFLRDDGTYVTADVVSGNAVLITDPLSPFYNQVLATSINIIPKKSVGLSWHNCWAFGNGVESNRIGDTYNKPYLTNGVAVSSTIEDNFKKEHKKYSLIYSGLYNSNSGVNNLNQFIAGEKITKDINPTYGSIQRLKAGWGQGGDLIALCEDRVLKILANKDALFNADGNTNVTSTNKVLGQAIPYSGEYGISTNPESFASEAYRAYFTDKVRGAVMRLSMDGLTPISDFGMKDWFRDNLKLNNKLVGSYDDKKDEYNLCLTSTTETTGKSVTFKENVKGWVSFKSFVTQNGISCANDYFTFLGGELFLHHHDVPGNRNTFYNVFKSSSFKVILNDAPGIVKSFYTLNYEGTQSKVDQLVIDPVTGLSDGEYYNLSAKKGWHVDSIETNKERGGLNEFIEKEGKWFNYIKGENIHLNANSSIHLENDGYSTWDQDSFAIQGLGALNGAPSPATTLGCTDATADNYNPIANLDDGSCAYSDPVPGCTTPSGTASNYDPLATVDDGSCLWFGCTDPTAINYAINYGGNFPPEAQSYDNALGNPPNAGIVDDNSCIYPAYGCTDPMMYNYDPNATAACDATGLAAGNNECCIPFIYGCLGQNDTFGNMILAEDAGNYGGPNNMNNVIPPVNTDDGSCQWDFCLNVLDVNNEDSNWSQDMIDQSVNYTVISPGYINFNDCADGGCTDATATNYDASATWDDGSCIPVSFNCIVPGLPCYDPGDGSGTYATQNDCNNNCVAALPGCTYGGNPLPGWFTVIGDGGPNTNDTWFQLYGISDPGAQASNYSGAATEDDGSCQWLGADVYGCADPTAGVHPDTNGDGSDGLPCSIPCTYGYDAVNFDPGATINDGSCISCNGFTSSITSITQPSAPGSCDGSFIIEINSQYPFTGSSGQFLTTTYPVVPQGAMSNWVFTNNNQTATLTFSGWCQEGAFTFYVLDQTNYPPSGAGACIISTQSVDFPVNVSGCTDPLAWDYDSNATVSTPCSSCTVDPTDPSVYAGPWSQNDANNAVYALANTPPTVLHNGQYWQWDPQFATGAPGITEEPGIDNGSTTNSPWIACEKQTTCTWVSIPHDVSGGWPPPSAGSNDWFGGGGNGLADGFPDNWSVFWGSQYSNGHIIKNNGHFWKYTHTLNNGGNYEPGSTPNPGNWTDANTPWSYCTSCTNCQ